MGVGGDQGCPGGLADSQILTSDLPSAVPPNHAAIKIREGVSTIVDACALLQGACV